MDERSRYCRNATGLAGRVKLEEQPEDGKTEGWGTEGLNEETAEGQNEKDTHLLLQNAAASKASALSWLN